MEWLKLHKGKALLFVSLLGVFGVLAWVLWGGWSIDEIKTWISGWVDEIKTWPAYLFFLATAVLPLTGFPISPLFIIASIRFGVAWGIPFSLAAVAINMVLAYWLSNKVLHGWIERLLRWWDYSIPRIKQENASKWILAVRFSGAPLVVQNYLLGLAHAPFWPYLVYSVISQSFFVVGFVVFGESFVTGKMGTALVGLAVLIFAFIVVALLRARYAQSKTKLPDTPVG